MSDRAALLLLAFCGLCVCWYSPAGAVVSAFALAAHGAQEAFRLRADLKIVKDSAAALLKHEARLNSIERAVEAATQERVG